MVKNKIIKKIYNDFLPVIKTKDILGILLFGSYSKDQQTNRSDIDICVVAPHIDNHDLYSYILSQIDVKTKKYDIRMFSELPIHIKIRIIEDGELIYSPNQYDLYEYFYFYRKLWEDQKRRQEITKKELLSF